jgi:hypothetical protein
MFYKIDIFEKALELTKAHASGGGSGSPADIFESIFRKMSEIAEKEGILEK